MSSSISESETLLFFFIDDIEFYSLRKAPFKLQMAAKLPGPTEFWAVAGIIGGVLFGFLAAGFLISLSFDLSLPSFVLGLMLAAISALFFTGVALSTPKEELLSGRYREYFVSAKHYSFDVVFTPVVRSRMEEDIQLHSQLTQLLSDWRLIEADNTILSVKDDLEGAVAMAKAELSVIDAVARVVAAFQLSQEDHFQALRQVSLEDLQIELDFQQQYMKEGEEIYEQATAG